MHHGVTFNFGSDKECSPALLHNYAFSIDSYSPINKFNSFINFSLLINAVILLLDCPVLKVYLYIHFHSVRCYFLYFNMIWPFI